MAVFTSANTGNWNNNATWTGGTDVPDEGDTVTVQNTHTVTMNDSKAADGLIVVGNDTTTAAIQVASGGKLEFLSGNAKDIILQLKGDLKVAGTLEIGSVATPITSTRFFTAKLNYSASLADGKYGLIIQAGGTCTMQGASKTYDRTLLNANNGGTCSTSGTTVTRLEGTGFTGKTGTITINGTDYTISSVTNDNTLVLSSTAGTQSAVSYVFQSDNLTLTTADSTGWADNDVIAIASTDRTYSHCEKAVLNGAASGTTLTIDGGVGSNGGLEYGHMGTSPFQAEIINLTRNVVVTAYNTGSVGYVYFENTAIVNLDWVEFSYLGDTATDKQGVVIKTTTGTVNIDRCSFHDFEDWGVYCTTTITTGTIDIGDCVGYNLATQGVAGHSGVRMAAMTGAGTNTLDNFWLIYVPNADANADTNGILIGGQNVTLTNCRVAGVRTYGNSAAFNWSNSSGQTISDCVAHSGSNGFSFSCNVSTLTNLTAWRCSNYGFRTQVTCHNNTFTNLIGFGNTTANLYLAHGSNLTFDTLTLNGDTVFGTTYGIELVTDTFGRLIKIINGSLGAASGVYAAHSTADFRTDSNCHYDLTLHNCLVASTETNNQASMSDSVIASQKHDQTAGLHKRWTKGGTIISETTTVDASPSIKATPISASVKLEIPVGMVNVNSGETVTFSVKVYEDASYNGNRARLIVKANPAAGIASDAVLDTATASSDEAWETLTGTTADTLTDDGVLEFVVDCDGSAGNLYVDTASCTVQT